ncbi:MAG: SH3-like domain-containing protein [Desulforhopalus sp.]|jgi:SH3-like domain-containing protein
MNNFFSNKYSKLRAFSVFFFLLTFLLLSVSSAIAEMISVKGDKINLRKGAGTKYSILWEYGNGYPLKIVKKKGNWIKVQDFEKDSGWIHKSLLNYDPHVIVKVNRNNDSKINIRKRPGTSEEIVGKAQYGVVFKTLNRKSGWTNVEHESGLKGWVKESLLWGY